MSTPSSTAAPFIPADELPPPTTEPQPIGSGTAVPPPTDPADVELPVTGAGVEIALAVAIVATVAGLTARFASRRRP